MGASARTRPRRLLLIAAAIALCAGLFFAIQSPLRAQSEHTVTIRFEGERYTVTSSEIEEQGDIRDGRYVIRDESGGERTIPVARGATLKRLLEIAGVPSRMGVIALQKRGGGTFYAERDDDLVFYDTRDPNNGIYWFEEQVGNRRNGINSGGDPQLVARGHRNLLQVELTSEPKEKPRAEESVTFTADPNGGLDGEEFRYDWAFGDGDTDSNAGDSVTHTFDKRDVYTVEVTVTGNKGSIGTESLDLSVRRKAPADNSGSGGSGSGGSGSGGSGSGGSGSGGGSSGGGGSFDPGSGVPSTPATPALPPPSSSPPSDPGRGPNLDPSAPGTAPTETGESVTGILVSTSAPARPGGNRPGQSAQSKKAEARKKDDEAFDWKLAGGISLTALLVILGGLRERVPIQRLLPQPQ